MGRACSTWISPTMIGFDCRSEFAQEDGKAADALDQGCHVGLPNFLLNWMRAHSQCPNCSRSATAFGWWRMLSSGLKWRHNAAGHAAADVSHAVPADAATA